MTDTPGSLAALLNSLAAAITAHIAALTADVVNLTNLAARVGALGASSATLSGTDKNSNVVISGAGLVATASNNTSNYEAGRGFTATTAMASGAKRYVETTMTNIQHNVTSLGLCNASETFADGAYVGSQANGLTYFKNGQVFKNGAAIVSGLAAFGVNDVIGMAIDAGNKVWFRKNGGNWNNDVIGNQDPASNLGGIDISALGTVYPAYNLAAWPTNLNEIITFNFGPTFAFPPPSGFTALP
jgi:hypothetical protein